MCIPARLSLSSAQELVQKIRQLAEELARLHQGDRRLAPQERDGFTLLLGFRSWEFAAFTALRRGASAAAPTASYQTGPRNR
ncbi:hypothetical protein D3C72_2279420 [compost metagenome]